VCNEYSPGYYPDIQGVMRWETASNGLNLSCRLSRCLGRNRRAGTAGTRYSQGTSVERRPTVDQQEGIALIRAAVDLGITFFDTA
jgi:hypothetical protein